MLAYMVAQRMPRAAICVDDTEGFITNLASAANRRVGKVGGQQDVANHSRHC